MTTQKVIDEIRKLMARCTDSEKELYEALVDEASGWEMRLQELEREDEDE